MTQQSLIGGYRYIERRSAMEFGPRAKREGGQMAASGLISLILSLLGR